MAHSRARSATPDLASLLCRAAARQAASATARAAVGVLPDATRTDPIGYFAAGAMLAARPRGSFAASAEVTAPFTLALQASFKPAR